MKRSEINVILQDAIRFIRDSHFALPPFAYWTVEDWQKKGEEVSEIVERKLGWDITDFGSGDFENTGLFLFTIRNGSPENLKTLQGKLYAEKILIIQVDQETPLHYHGSKMEDIINRCGGSWGSSCMPRCRTEAWTRRRKCGSRWMGWCILYQQGARFSCHLGKALP